MLKATALMALAIFLAGCAAAPTVTEQQRIGANLAEYQTVLVSVEAADEIRQRNGYDVTAKELVQQFMDNLAARGKSATTGAPSGGAKALEARLTITDLNYVSGAARAATGIFAGRAKLGVTLTVKDHASGTVLGVVSASDASSHAQGVFSPSTGRQIDAIAKELASKL